MRDPHAPPRRPDFASPIARDLPRAATTAHDESVRRARVKKIAHPTRPTLANGVAPEPQYKNPLNLAFRPDGTRAVGHLRVGRHRHRRRHSARERRSPRSRSAARRPTSPSAPTARAPSSPTGSTTPSPSSTRPRARSSRRSRSATSRTASAPTAQGKLLYVLNTSSDDISVIDAASLEGAEALAASRNPWSVALSPDGATHAGDEHALALRPFRRAAASPR